MPLLSFLKWSYLFIKYLRHPIKLSFLNELSKSYFLRQVGRQEKLLGKHAVSSVPRTHSRENPLYGVVR